MKFTTGILKGVICVNLAKLKNKISFFSVQTESVQAEKGKNSNPSAFMAIVRKEFTDYIRSWRILILGVIILLACIGSLYTAITSISDAIDQAGKEAETLGSDLYLFLQLFTVSDGTLPSFITFVGFLGPLFGIALGFDSINSERNRGTLSRLLSQPIPRDYLINAKFVAALLLNVLLFFSLGLLVMAFGILILGIPPTFEEFLRIFFFLCLCIVYIAFWLNLGILFSVVFKSQATSALSSIAVWIFFNVFYSMIINLVSKSLLNPEKLTSVSEVLNKQGTVLTLMRFSPNYLFSESTTILLSPNVRSLGPLTVEQTVGAVAGPLPLSQSLLLIWPQLTGLVAATLICFAIAYLSFMRQEIRTN